MIISKDVDIIINKGNISIYKKLGYIINIGDIIKIDINKISHGSSVKVRVMCQFCEVEKDIEYKLYTKQLKRNDLFACCKKCSAKRLKSKLMREYGVSNIAQIPEIKDRIKDTNKEKFGSEFFFSSNEGKEKIRQSMIEKYGVDNPQKNEEIKNSTKRTNQERYGKEYVLGVSDIRDKIKITNLKRYGFEQASKSDGIKDKIKKTNQERYGGNSAMCNNDIKNKSKNSLLRNYGVDSPLRSELIKKKIVETNMSKIGVEYPTQSDIVRNKIKETNLKKYGSEFIGCSELIRRKWYSLPNNEFYIKYISDGVSLFNCDCGKDHTFEINTDNYFSRIKNNISICTICKPIGNMLSFKEIDLLSYIQSIYSKKILSRYRDKMEIDIYLPDDNLGFEFNGLYWHTEEFRDKNYHLNKSNYFKDKGIRIFHIWEDDWVKKNDIIKSQIKNLLGMSDKIYARKCTVLSIENKECSNFLEENHIQGSVNSILKLGLYYENNLVSVMTFDKFEGRKKMKSNEWNLSRFCNKIGISVVGGASKILKHFIDEYKPSRIISYADKSWSNGELYKKLKFDLVSDSNPDYKYKIGSDRIHKSRFRKDRLSTTLSESEYMRQNNVYKIWDCGKMKFEINF